MMAPLSWRYVALGIVLLVISSALYFKTQSLDVEKHRRTVTTLRELKRVDVNLNESVLKVGYGVLRQYDPLVLYIRDYHRLLRALDIGDGATADRGRDEIGREYAQLKSNVNDKIEAAQQFTRANAILRNSLIFLPIASRQVADALPKTPRTPLLLHFVQNLRGATLMYNLTKERRWKREARELSEQLLHTSSTASSDVKDHVALFQRHVMFILDHTQTVDTFLTRIVSAPTAAGIDRLTSIYLNNYELRQKQTGTYRLVLYIFSVLLLVYIGYILIQLQHYMRTLRYREASIRTLYKMTSAPHQRFEDKLNDLLHIGCSHLGFETGIFAKAENCAFRVVAAASTYEKPMKGDLLPTGTGKLQRAGFGDKFGTGMDVPVSVSGENYGQLGFYSQRLRQEPPDPTDREFLRLMAQWIGGELEREGVRRALFQEKEYARTTLESIGDGVITTDPAGRVTYVNPVAEKITGWAREYAVAQPLDQVYCVVNEDTGDPEPSPIDACLKKGRSIYTGGQGVLTRRDGSKLAVSSRSAPILDNDDHIVGIVVTFHDVSKDRALKKQLSHQASHDPLTDLINRREFEIRLEHALVTARNEAKGHVLCYLDLDQFKVINDTCGHRAGDELLRQLASLLSAQLRGTDALARLGGDEFAVLLDSCPLPVAQKIAESMRRAVRAFKFSWGGKRFEVGVSIGLAPVAADCESIEELLSSADLACLMAKERGRNRVHIYESEDTAIIQRRGEMQWVSRITSAIRESQLCLYDQVIIPVTGVIESERFSEVLVRMLDRDGELIPPGAFIPAAERFGLMPEIDRWVVETICNHCANTERENSRYAVNLSGASLSDARFFEFVREQLRKNRISPGTICFEITETAAIRDLSNAVSFINKLKREGCLFALDDFGSGVSSFAYLKHLPVDFLKIDGSFIKDLAFDSVDHAMVDAISKVAQTLGIKSIAESVEDANTLPVLQQIGVDYVQGYAIEMPKPLVSLKLVESA